MSPWSIYSITLKLRWLTTLQKWGDLLDFKEMDANKMTRLACFFVLNLIYLFSTTAMVRSCSCGVSPMWVTAEAVSAPLRMERGVVTDRISRVRTEFPGKKPYAFSSLNAFVSPVLWSSGLGKVSNSPF